MYDIIIIGSGPAGMTSAIYAARENKKLLVLEQGIYGGQIVNSSIIENYPGFMNIDGVSFANSLYQQMEHLRVEFKNETVVKIINGSVKEVITNNSTYQCKAIIIATGLSNRMLELENEKNLIGHGVSYCATCDGMLYRDKVVAVVGGGNTALEDVVFLSNYCKLVYLIHRSDHFRGESKTLDLIRTKNNVKIVTNSVVTKLIGVEKLEGIEINHSEFMAINGLFIAIGKIPNNHFLENLVLLDEEGYIQSNEKCETNIEGIFVAGDCRGKDIRQLTTATSDGTIAAIHACKYIDQIY